MSDLFDDWQRYCQGSLDVDKSYFLGLFKIGMTDAQMQSALEFFPASKEIKDRLANVLAAGTLEHSIYMKCPPVTDRDGLLAAAEAWLEELARFCPTAGEIDLGRIAQEAEIVLCSEGEIEKRRAEDNPNAWLFDALTDSVLSPLSGSSRIDYALREALCGIAADYYLAWYIAQPLLQMDIDFSKYFDFWKQGGDGVLTEGAFLIRGDVA